MINTDTSTLQLQPCIAPRNIMYYRTDSMDVNPSCMEKIEEDTCSLIHICDSWNTLIAQMGIIATKSEPVPLILLDITLFNKSDTMLHELISMITTLHRCMFPGTHLQLAVVIEKHCSAVLLRELRESELAGMVPWSTLCGYDVTVSAIRNILSGKLYWPRDILHQVTEASIIKLPSKNGILLTRRQTQVLVLVRDRGLSNKKIAQVLKITESTVKIHISAILKEYGVQNRTQLALAANSGLYAKHQ